MREWKTSSKDTSGAASRSRAIALLAGRDGGSELSSMDRSFSYRLFRESVVWRKRLDRALAPCCTKSLGKLDPVVLAALRVGAVQLLILRTPAHAAVSSTVEAIRGHRGSGLVNAVLRRLSRTGEPPAADAPLHDYYSHPEDLTQRWLSRFDSKGTERLMEWNNGIPPVGAFLFDDIPNLQAGKYLPDYRLLTRSGGSPLSGIEKELYVQDEATAIVAAGAAQLARGGEVLELCAAPGGKTHHLCRTAKHVIAVDSSPHRMALWQDNRNRIGWSGCSPIVALGESLPVHDRFDLVMVDAPCTNTGVYRRRADARWSWSSDLLGRCVRQQRRLLSGVADAVKPDGILIYSTCSLEPEENISQVEWFETGFREFTRIPFPAPDLLVKAGLISIFPPEHGIDGIFAAAWRRNK